MRHPLFGLIVLASLLSGCSVDRLPFVYKPDLHQGTILSQEAVDQLRAGMTRRQVRFVLGSPPLVDPFHPNRWDYIEAEKPGGDDWKQRRVSVYFEDDRLVRVEGDLQPQDPNLLRGG